MKKKVCRVLPLGKKIHFTECQIWHSANQIFSPPTPAPISPPLFQTRLPYLLPTVRPYLFSPPRHPPLRPSPLRHGAARLPLSSPLRSPLAVVGSGGGARGGGRGRHEQWRRRRLARAAVVAAGARSGSSGRREDQRRWWPARAANAAAGATNSGRGRGRTEQR